MTHWLLAIAGWSAATYYRAALALAKRAERNARSDAAAVKLALHFATEKLAEFIDRANAAESEVMRLQGKIRAAELEESARRRRAN